MADMEEKLQQWEETHQGNYRIGRLGYNDRNKRFGILYSDLWVNEGLHCGNSLVYWESTENEWVESCIEMDYEGHWYIVGASCPHGELEYIKVLVPVSRTTV